MGSRRRLWDHTDEADQAEALEIAAAVPMDPRLIEMDGLTLGKWRTFCQSVVGAIDPDGVLGLVVQAPKLGLLSGNRPVIKARIIDPSNPAHAAVYPEVVQIVMPWAALNLMLYQQDRWR